MLASAYLCGDYCYLYSSTFWLGSFKVHADMIMLGHVWTHLLIPGWNSCWLLLVLLTWCESPTQSHVIHRKITAQVCRSKCVLAPVQFWRVEKLRLGYSVLENCYKIIWDFFFYYHYLITWFWRVWGNSIETSMYFIWKLKFYSWSISEYWIVFGIARLRNLYFLWIILPPPKGPGGKFV